jgi:hypothetical protein
LRWRLVSGRELHERGGSAGSQIHLGHAINKSSRLNKIPALPSSSDGAFIGSLMKQVVEPGKFASWIAPPRIGIDNKPGDFEYVRIAA